MTVKLLRALLAVLVVLSIAQAVSPGAADPGLASMTVPKVVLVVGPVGELTRRYRALADEAARVARDAGAEVVKVYSPDATWARVKRAAAGASVLVYLGHGNGWPSRYRDDLYPPTQNGFGLNPVAHDGDDAHEYFGEAAVEDLRLAPDSVVVLSHLCYASGNTEPGLPEGTQRQAIQRVDNYAAGFIRAGAGAVVAEGHLGPAYYVRALLTTSLSVERIWDRSPTAHGNTFRTKSVRSPGFASRLDPDRPSRGFYRSLVSRGVTAAELRTAARGSTGGSAVTDVANQPSLAGLGLTFAAPRLAASPVVGAQTDVALDVAAGRAGAIPSGVELGVRWEPLVLDTVLTPPPVEPAAGATASPPVDPAAGATASPPVDPAAATPSASATGVAGVEPALAAPAPAGPAPAPAPSRDPVDTAPEVDLIVPEREPSTVDPARARVTKTGLSVRTRYPSAPGLYRLVTTIHADRGDPFDAATQALLVPVLVRVGAKVSVAYGAPAGISLGAGTDGQVAVRLVNTGSRPWEQRIKGGLITRLPASLVATWVSTEGRPVPAPVSVLIDADASAPGGDDTVTVELVAPADPGSYLVMLDVLSPSLGPLSARGIPPGIVRVTVTGPAVAAPGPASVERVEGEGGAGQGSAPGQ